MKSGSSHPLEERIALVVAGLNFMMLLAAFVVYLTHSDEPFLEYGGDEYALIVAGVSATLVYNVLAILIITRYPRHMVGWLFMLVGFFAPLMLLSNSMTATFFYAGSDRLQILIDWTIAIAWIPTFFILLSLALLYFPDGKLPSLRWWPVAAAAILGIVVQVVEEFTDLPDFLGLLFLIGGLGSLAAVIVRFRRARGIQRLQLKWLVFVSILGTVGLYLSSYIIADPDSSYVGYIFFAFPTLVGFAIGFAILRYRLYDIDLIIRRTLQYTLLTGLLALTYFGGVVLLQTVAGALTGQEDSPIVIVLTTLGIAALFNPLRGRVQDLIDRRFYRSKYDAEKTLSAFSAGLRDDLDLDMLHEQIEKVIDDTMQPTRITIWLK
jgi:hypothetical protein